jgi:hypothetical protein
MTRGKRRDWLSQLPGCSLINFGPGPSAGHEQISKFGDNLARSWEQDSHQWMTHL